MAYLAHEKSAVRVIDIRLRALGTSIDVARGSAAPSSPAPPPSPSCRASGAALDLNVHLHTALPDGVLDVQDDDNPGWGGCGRTNRRFARLNVSPVVRFACDDDISHDIKHDIDDDRVDDDHEAEPDAPSV